MESVSAQSSLRLFFSPFFTAASRLYAAGCVLIGSVVSIFVVTSWFYREKRHYDLGTYIYIVRRRFELNNFENMKSRKEGEGSRGVYINVLFRPLPSGCMSQSHGVAICLLPRYPRMVDEYCR